MRTDFSVLSYGYSRATWAMVIAPESSDASSENAAVDARSACAARRSTSSTKSMSGVSRTRAESPRHATDVWPIGVSTYCTVAACAALTAATIAGDSACLTQGTSDDHLRATVQWAAPTRCSTRCATDTLVAQFLGCVRRTPLMTVSAISRCEWPYTIRSMPGTSRATRAATFSLGRCVSTVS